MKSGMLRLFPLLLASLLADNKLKGDNNSPLGGRTAGYGAYGQYKGKTNSSHKKHRNRLLMVKESKLNTGKQHDTKSTKHYQ